MPSKLSKTAECLCVCFLASTLIITKSFAFDKKTSFALSHYIMGVIHEDLGDIDLAIEEFKKALKDERETSLIHLRLAESLIKKNDVTKAIAELKLASNIEPEAVEPHAILALLYFSQNRLDLATSEYEKALKGASKLNPRNIDIYSSLGRVYLEQKRFKEAEQVYKLIIDLSPDDAQAHFYLGSVYNELKNKSLSEKEIKRALELKPDYAEALNFLGYLYVEENKDLKQAEVMIKKALAIEPNNGAYIDSLGWLYFKQGNFKEAIKELEKAAGLLEDAVIYEHLGEAYFKINDITNAKLNWQKSLKLDPQQENIKKKIEGLK